MSEETVQLQNKNLEQLIKAFSGNIPVARVGILGDKTVRQSGEDKTPTNAEVGAAHEFGTSKLPIRSFLRVPLTLKLNQTLEQSGAFKEDTIKRVIKDGSIENWVQKIGIVGEGIVQNAFDTNGFGLWKISKMTHKKTKQTLVETQQLRKAITSDVKK